ncbi:unnamed protein product [Musa textilis]
MREHAEVSPCEVEPHGNHQQIFDPNWISSSLQSEEGNHQFEQSGRTGSWRLTLQMLLTPIRHAVSSSSCTIFTLVNLRVISAA